MTPTTKICPRCGIDKSSDDYYKSSSSADGLKPICKDCWKAGGKSTTHRAPTERSTRAAMRSTRTVATDTGYVASRRLQALWSSVRAARIVGDEHPMNLLFLGPSGSGKTAAAEYLALVAELPFTKVDAASMTDPESWFGTREVVSENGVSVTTYRPSAFVLAITQPGVLLIDEINRVRDEHRNVLLPLLDGTHKVTNPLTGEIVAKSPDCYVIMSGNRGLQFTGTYPIDPALMTRSLTELFDYLSTEDEIAVAMHRTGCTQETAALFVRFASESRDRASQDSDINPISTREVLYACSLVAGGMDADDAVVVAMLNGVNDEGGVESIRHRLETIWTGIRPSRQTPKVNATNANPF
jgi:MoxR-like ATPase